MATGLFTFRYLSSHLAWYSNLSSSEKVYQENVPLKQVANGLKSDYGWTDDEISKILDILDKNAIRNVQGWKVMTPNTRKALIQGGFLSGIADAFDDALRPPTAGLAFIFMFCFVISEVA
jgi:hypothetical protein